MLRKCAVIFITVHLRQYGPSSQVVAASIVLSLSTSAQMYFLPYIDPKHNMIESFGCMYAIYNFLLYWLLI